MFKWLKKKKEAWDAKRKLARQIDPRQFKRMAGEIRDLALLAAQLSPDGKDIRQLIRNVITEMDRLSELADKPEFRRLSTGKRLLLRQGLLESREQLLESIESAPAPTHTMQ
ncbi:hypothetical protein [Pseudodesulfovibrio sp.]|uniref:hypothetical protein n=1 Tax=Pseudodesulfovibrio sp. TaxID=2035812 RepID=UPI002628E40D|nr:hypothetical protein [Pseudodesulfovibrio sp.]MDD3313247.1 hypothetical protein [Pseudodesulfovibrio sp.]